MPDMQEVPEGRCLVCRAAFEPCRRCKGKVHRAKCEATMEKNGTTPKRKANGPGIDFRRRGDA